MPRPGEHPDTPTLCSSPMVALRRRAEADELTVIEGTATWAEPGGLIQRQAYEGAARRNPRPAAAALPVDAVILGLHGAMVAQGYDDCEGDLLARVRAIVGPDVRDRRRTRSAQPFDAEARRRGGHPGVLPRIPAHRFLRARRACGRSRRCAAARGEIRPVMSTFDCRMIAVLPTSREPMRSFVDRIKALHGKDGVLSVSVIHGFMAADVPEMGTQHPRRHRQRPRQGRRAGQDARHGAVRHAREGRDDDGRRRATASTRRSRRASANPAKPAVIADVWDNPGGGVAGDGTVVLRQLIERGIGRVGVATIWDPIAVTFCHAAGEGAVIDLRFGGKAGPLAGEPIDARVRVLKVGGRGLAEFWPEPGDARPGGAGPHRRHRDRHHPQHQPYADVRARHLLQSRRRPARPRTYC